MRLSDLLRMDVIDEHGTPRGRVRDLELRFVKGERARRLEIEAVLFGKGGFAERFGYLHGPVRGPGLLAAVLRRLAREPHRASWTRSTRVDNARLVLASGRQGPRRAAR